MKLKENLKVPGTVKQSVKSIWGNMLYDVVLDSGTKSRYFGDRLTKLKEKDNRRVVRKKSRRISKAN